MSRKNVLNLSKVALICLAKSTLGTKMRAMGPEAVLIDQSQKPWILTTLCNVWQKTCAKYIKYGNSNSKKIGYSKFETQIQLVFRLKLGLPGRKVGVLVKWLSTEWRELGAPNGGIQLGVYSSLCSCGTVIFSSRKKLSKRRICWIDCCKYQRPDEENVHP